MNSMTKMKQFRKNGLAVVCALSLLLSVQLSAFAWYSTPGANGAEIAALCGQIENILRDPTECIQAKCSALYANVGQYGECIAAGEDSWAYSHRPPVIPFQ